MSTMIRTNIGAIPLEDYLDDELPTHTCDFSRELVGVFLRYS